MFQAGDTVLHTKSATFYKIVAMAENAENGKEGEKIVVYRNFQGKVFTRPYDEFVEIVKVNNTETLPRFKKVNFVKKSVDDK